MAAVSEVPAFRDGRRATLAALAAAGLGLVVLLLGAASDPRQALFSYLTAFAYVLSIQLGALIFLMMGHAARSVWTIPVRKLTEAVASGLFAAPLFFLPVVLGAEQLYAWAGEPPHGEPIAFLPGKQAYLNVPSFAVRAVLYFAVWIGLVLSLRRWSVAADRDEARGRDAGVPLRVSAGGLPLLAITLTLAAIDWLMSLEPAWFSSMYGIYFFAGAIVAALGLVTVLSFVAERTGWLRGYVHGPHYHALGRLLLTFTIFWTYIAFFQLFLIYIANRPEEVAFYVRRTRGAWVPFAYVLLFGHFVLPFLVLLLRGIKFRPRLIASVGAYLVLVHYLDVYWLVMPALHPQGFAPHATDLGALLLLGGAASAVSVLLLRGQPIVPRNDPRLLQAIRYRSL